MEVVLLLSDEKLEAIAELCRAYGVKRLDLQDGLREVLGTEVDLVMVAAVRNRYLARAIELTKLPLYAA